MRSPPATSGKTKMAVGTTSDREKGGEQGDTLMPLLFSLGVHNSLVEGKRSMRPGEYLLAYLDDTFILSQSERARPLYNAMDLQLQTRAGIRLNAGKTRVWNRAGIQPPNMDDLGEDVWSPEGIKVLGSPIGSEAFVQAFTERRLDSEQRLWNAIPSIPDLQCAWQLLLQCAGPRCNHLLRTILPNQRHMRQDTTGMQQTMVALLGTLPGDHEQTTMAHNLASLPMRLGGLGLRSARRLAPAAYWASWSDAVPVLQERVPEATAIITRELAGIPPRLFGRVAHRVRDFGP